jgi:hypothetical protein
VRLFLFGALNATLWLRFAMQKLDRLATLRAFEGSLIHLGSDRDLQLRVAKLNDITILQFSLYNGFPVNMRGVRSPFPGRAKVPEPATWGANLQKHMSP